MAGSYNTPYPHDTAGNPIYPKLGSIPPVPILPPQPVQFFPAWPQPSRSDVEALKARVAELEKRLTELTTVEEEKP